MIASTGGSGSSSQQQPPTAGDSAHFAATGLSSPTNSVKNIKSEPFLTATLSPDNTNSQNMLDDTKNINNNNASGVSIGGNSSSSSNNNSGPGDIPAPGSNSGSASASLLRQNSTVAVSPNNNSASDHSNCSNISTGMSQLADDAATDTSQDQKTKKKLPSKEEDNAINNKGNNAKSTASSQLVSVKEESDIIASLVNVKKEENISPKMSPVGFGALVTSGSSSDVPGLGSSAPAAVKIEHSSLSNEKMSTSLNISPVDSESQSGNSLLASTSVNDACTSAAASGSGNNGANVGIGIGGGGALSSSGTGGQFISGGTIGNCMDYMQQQNHIFVFSTQLANKGADAVLNGQFQTIIAYHCTQPATKNFLEDFFLKNPMKMNKLQRQNSALTMCNLAAAATGAPWSNAGGGVGVAKQQKLNGGKVNFAQLDNSNKAVAQNIRTPTHVHNAFGESADAALANDNDLICWEQQTRNALEGVGDGTQAIKLLDGSVDSVVGALGKCNDGDGGIPSLQGVKVPDENLTPQQRQHREEQLAKLKKMNQFLFPEHDNSPTGMSAQNPLNKLVNDSMPNNMLMNMTAGGNPGAAAVGGNPALNQAMQRQMQTANLLNPNKSEHISGGSLGDDVMLANEIIGDLTPGHSLVAGNQQCSANPQKGTCVGVNSQPGNMTCGPGNVLGVNVTNMNVSNLTCHGGNGASSVISASSPEIISSFGGPNCGVGVGGINVGDMPKGLALQDMPPIGMAQIEWSKMQQQFFEERMKGSKAGGRHGMVSGQVSLSTQPPNTSNTNALANHNMRNNNQGPPPPYHPTQRSASVPIATQSPNPASPNNPTSNLSLPSPRTAATLGIPANSPNIDAGNVLTSSSTNMATTTTTTASVTPTMISTAGVINNAASSKNCFQSGEGGSPSNRSRVGSSGLNQFNSNPSTPLSHMSPKDLESFNSNANLSELKNPRPSPQRSRSPSTGNNLMDTVNLDVRFPASSPGLNFSTQMQNNPNAAINTAYKSPNPLERQSAGPVGIGGGPAQFCRRTDNMPLNPNSNRPAQNKINQGFDPISSLAQMSQQLTSCVSTVGSSPAGGINVLGTIPGAGGPNDMNIMNQNIEGMLPTMDPNNSIEHMNNAGPFAPNCHPMNPLMNQASQRILNQKMCGAGPVGFNQGVNGPGVVGNSLERQNPGGVPPGFNPGGPNGPGPNIRDVPGPNFHGVMPPAARMMGRMPVNFGNFHASPNIQVKASTPNTIQYMPVRPQNHNNNIRMPPSLEFLQRYANPQMTGGGGVGPMGSMPGDNSHLLGGIGPMNAGNANEQNKVNNPGNMPPIGGLPPGVNNPGGMNFFQNCNQLPHMSEDESGLPNGMLPSHDMNIGGAPMIRGMRPHGGIRQHGMGPRLQTTAGNIMGLGGQQSQYPTVPGPNGPEGIDCSDTAALFAAGALPCNNVPGGQSVLMGGNIITGSVGGGGGVNNVLSGPPCPGGIGGSGNPNYKPFVGPSSNDLKYAQQYHSFQQQLYATTTRSQPQQQQPGPNNVNMNPNLSPNPAFFANK